MNNMARIYFNSPCSNSNGNKMPPVWRWILLAVIIIVALSIFLPLPHIFSFHKSHAAEHLQELHYGIVIDCGSSGSRVFVYFWPTHSGNPRDLLDIQQLLDDSGKAVVKKVSPGLSSFEDNPGAASDHIKELLLYAQKYIPANKYPETVLYVLATAGMRMLPESAQRAILLDLRNDIKKDFSFIAPENHFEVISGKQEGVYAWIAINYVLGRFSHSSAGSDSSAAPVELVHSVEGETAVTHTRKRTVGIIDMGGGSVQIAFEVTDLRHSKDIPRSLLSEFNLGCQESDIEHTYQVYVTTFLGYGANSARERYEDMLIQQSESQTRGVFPLRDVCLPAGMKQSSKNDNGETHDFVGLGDYEACKRAVEPLMNLTVPCSKKPCSLNGVYQPHIDLSSEFYGFSEFWYSAEDVFGIGGPYSYEEYQSKAKEFCSTSWEVLSGRYKQNLYPKADDHRFRFQCFKSAWMSQVFHKGLSFPTTYRKFTSAQLVNGKDVGWTLGALIYKTRFLPLRDVEKLTEQLQVSSNWRHSYSLDVSFMLMACCFVVLTAIVVYMKWLKCCPRRADLSRVPSMSYFMTDQDQIEQGLQFTKGQGFIL
ncbi:unnamed protein product [Candidula unifasciata]|uniref:Apyrase n=1 Tax=Candidula unifasciata TaxID=100452 RepID=A0A8S3YG97_9EUPU|nr:unnamed protein product [Candidula unifasciata]